MIGGGHYAISALSLNHAKAKLDLEQGLSQVAVFLIGAERNLHAELISVNPDAEASSAGFGEALGYGKPQSGSFGAPRAVAPREAL